MVFPFDDGTFARRMVRGSRKKSRERAAETSRTLRHVRLRPPRHAGAVPGVRSNSADEEGNRLDLNFAAMVALLFMHYNYCRVHQSPRVTPAMSAGVTDHVWELEELVGLID
jgi:hypothetical protein